VVLSVDRLLSDGLPLEEIQALCSARIRRIHSDPNMRAVKRLDRDQTPPRESPSSFHSRPSKPFVAIFEFDRSAIKKSAQEQGELRATEARGIVDRLGECLEGPVAKSLLPASKLGGAFNTIRKHWEAFNVFAHDVACSQRAEDGYRCRDVFREAS